MHPSIPFNKFRAGAFCSYLTEFTRSDIPSKETFVRASGFTGRSEGKLYRAKTKGKFGNFETLKFYSSLCSNIKFYESSHSYISHFSKFPKFKLSKFKDLSISNFQSFQISKFQNTPYAVLENQERDASFVPRKLF